MAAAHPRTSSGAVVLQTLLNDPPAFHYWNDQPQTGGMGPRQFDAFSDACQAFASDRDDGPRPLQFVETGAGLSTLWFLSQGFHVQSFIDSAEVIEKMRAYLAAYPELDAAWTSHVGASEMTLPAFAAATNISTDVVLIDGGHAMQNVYIDFTYTNHTLRQGGFLFVDDTQLASPRSLYFLLRDVGDFEEFPVAGKMKAFRKVSGRRLLGDFAEQRHFLERLKRAFPDSDM